jgi:hypothetical protein
MPTGLVTWPSVLPPSLIYQLLPNFK